MTTLGTAIDQVLRKSGAGFKVPNGSIGGIAAGTLTSVDYFLGGTKYSNNSFQGWYILRPGAASAADYIRRVASLAPSTGVVSNDSNWSDTTLGTEDAYFLPPWLRPQFLVDAANLALEKIYSKNIEPLSSKPVGTGLSDAGFQSSATSAYTAVNATFTKIATANSGDVYQGFGSGQTVLTAGDGHVYQRFEVVENEPVNVFGLSRRDSGTSASLVLATGAATNSLSALGTTVTHGEPAFQWMKRNENIPSGHKYLEVRFGGTDNADDINWGGQCVLFPERSRLILDTKWDSDFKATHLTSVQLGGSSPEEGVWPANAARLVPIPPSDYSFSFERGGPHPTVINWQNNAQRHWCQWPVFITGRRPTADFVTALTLASWATDIPVDKDLWDAAIRQELFSMDDILSADANNARRLGRASYDFQAVSSQFHEVGPTRHRTFSNMGFVRG